MSHSAAGGIVLLATAMDDEGQQSFVRCAAFVFRRNERSRHSIACLAMAVYRTAFPIEASAEAVWEVLTDFGSYSE
jgi:hypothetical protein